jgi:Protein kinase domain
MSADEKQPFIANVKQNPSTIHQTIKMQKFQKWILKIVPRLLHKYRKTDTSNSDTKRATQQKSVILKSNKLHKRKQSDNATCDSKTKLIQDVSTGIFYSKGKQLGTGAFKIVYEACAEHPNKKSACLHPVVIIEQSILSSNDEDIFNRELYFASVLSSYGLAPQIVHIEECQHTITILMERMTMNFRQLGQIQTLEFFKRKHSTTHFPVLLYTLSQFNSVIQLIFAVNLLNITLGDLKGENIMVDKTRTQFKFIDFGLSGDYSKFIPKWGFTHNYGCPSEKNIPQGIGVAANLWQFFTSICGEVFVLLWNDISNQNGIPSSEMYLVDTNSIQESFLNPDEWKYVQQVCPFSRIQASLQQELTEEQRMRDHLLLMAKSIYPLLTRFSLSLL